VWPRRNGKDLICFNVAIAKAVQRVGLYYYMAPYYNQVRQIIWEGTDGSGRRFLDYIPGELIESKTKIDMRINLFNGSQIKLCGSDNIDSIVGTNPIGIVFTEFSLHKPEAWEYLRPILAENGGWAIFNGTPRGMNHFFALAQKAEKDPEWFYERLTCEDTGIPTKEAIEKERRDGMPESLVQQEFFTSWTSSSEETLIPLDIVESAIDLEVKAEEYKFAPRILGVDVAFAVKGDQAVIAMRQGRRLWPLERFQGVDNMALATRIADKIKTWKPDAVCIDYGRGEGVIHRLWQMGYRDEVIPVNFSQKPFSSLYMNKRAEIFCRVRDWFLQANKPSIPYDPDLIASLTAPTFTTNDRGFIQIESKLQIRKRLGRSTDELDAVALTFSEEFEEIKPKETTDWRRNYIVEDIPTYDPLSHMENIYEKGERLYDLSGQNLRLH